MDEDEIPFLQDLRAAYTKRLRILLIRGYPETMFFERGV